MKVFKDIGYVRPNIDQFKEGMHKNIQSLNEAINFDDALSVVEMTYKQLDDIFESMELVGIRRTLNTEDPFYTEEQAFIDEHGPEVEEMLHMFSQAIMTSPFQKDFETKYGSLMFDKKRQNAKTFHPSIMDDLKEENKLTTLYGKLMASAEIEFDGKINNLSMMVPYVQHENRDTRHQAQLAVSRFFENNESEFDRIYDALVKVRTVIAQKLGYDNFVKLAYDRLGRLDYTEKEVKKYREQILNTVVPVVSNLMARKSKRLEIKDLKSYDLGLQFKNGNPTPKGTQEQLTQAAQNMYDEMGEVTSRFFKMMVDRELMDLDSRAKKEGGGYCTYLFKEQVPFIFANFNGTSHDVDVLTHEAGHALQMHLSRNLHPDYRMPTLECAEIHSMSMEFISWPWMPSFFKEDVNKYYFAHLSSSIEFLPYGALIDHFQHEVYTNPNWSKDERKEAFRKLEKQYMPYKDYDDDQFLEKGTYWYRQSHVFQAPFYYIDYTLAQVVAFQFWHLYRTHKEKTFNTYLEICSQGGSLTFTDLLKMHELENPFEDGAIKKIMSPLIEYLNNLNDKEL
jgi:M3 family oligoendopeptidase